MNEEYIQLYKSMKETFEGAEFTELKSRCKEVNKNYKKLIKEAKARSVRNVITKGAIQNVLPFENELDGVKLNGKQIADPIFHNECKIYHFDDEDRLILIEHMSEFLKMITYYTFYFYSDTQIEKIYGERDEFYRIRRTRFVDGKAKCAFQYYTDEEKTYSEYIYDSDMLIRQNDYLVRLDEKKKVTYPYVYDFLYDAKGKLSSIMCNYPFGGKQYSYSISKINYKKLEERLYDEINQEFKYFLSEHMNEKFSRFGLDCYSGHVPSFVSLCADTTDDDGTIDSPVDWEYYDFKEIRLLDIPLDDKQSENLLITIAKALVRFAESEEFVSYQQKENFKIVFLNHQGIVIDDIPKVSKILANKVFI